jgi:beta-lactamase superfamily II metal-dependent hydrolase
MSIARQIDRRTLLKSLVCTAAATTCGLAFASDDDAKLHGPPTALTAGFFDIHHIDTARGNSTLLIFPDSTTMLIDAGDVSGAAPGTINPARPNGTTLRSGEVIARYILAHSPKPRLDYFIATHIHGDHVDGLTDVAAQIPIATFIDRAYPNYAPNQLPSPAPFAKTYLALLADQAKQGRNVEAARVGSVDQITARKNPVHYANFEARILSANGNIWNPATKAVDAHLASIPAATNAHGYENNFSIATRFQYGPFSYFTGGDLDCDTFDGQMPKLDIETPVARACGRVEVAVADHHGYFDACGPAFVKALDAQAYVVPSWDIGHPGSAQLQRMMGAWDKNGGKATHDVFTLELLPQNALLNRRFAGQLKSQTGHVVIRVAPGGATYKIFSVDSAIENGNITGIFGPYTSRI